jgi:pilus assembly protein Flp/PilA
MGKNILLNILRDTRGATAVEYGLLLALIAMAAAVGMTGFANEVSNLWTKVGTTINSGISAS